MNVVRAILATRNGDLAQAMEQFLAERLSARLIATEVGPIDTRSKVANIVAAYNPELVILDSTAFRSEWHAIVHDTKSVERPIAVIVLTPTEDERYRRAVEVAGADGGVGLLDISTRLLPMIDKLFA